MSDAEEDKFRREAARRLFKALRRIYPDRYIVLIEPPPRLPKGDRELATLAPA
jgi:hypothetical protein